VAFGRGDEVFEACFAGDGGDEIYKVRPIRTVLGVSLKGACFKLKSGIYACRVWDGKVG
jgi:hypothetical protein